MTHDSGHLIQSDPLKAIRRELVRAARRQRSARRRRGVLVTAVAAVGLLALTGGALAITGSATGVPAIDNWLNHADETSSKLVEEREPGDDGKAPVPDVTPVPGTVSNPFEISLGDGTSAKGVGYQSRDGTICAALADPGDTALPPRGGSACVGVDVLAAALAKDPVRVVGAGGLRPRGEAGSPLSILKGFATDDVRRLFVTVPGMDRVESALSDPWVPGNWHAGPLRAFFAAIDVVPSSGSPGNPLAGAKIEAQLADGRIVTIHP
jgi:hypothetical protein